MKYKRKGNNEIKIKNGNPEKFEGRAQKKKGMKTYTYYLRHFFLVWCLSNTVKTKS